MQENETEKKLPTPAQRKAIETLLTCGNVSQAAEAANVNRNTLYRWMQDAVFVAELRSAEQLAVEGLSRSLAGLGDSAAAALRDALRPGEKMSTRLRASEIVIGNLLRLRELVNIEQRLHELEGLAHGQSQAQTPGSVTGFTTPATTGNGAAADDYTG